MEQKALAWTVPIFRDGHNRFRYDWYSNFVPGEWNIRDLMADHPLDWMVVDEAYGPDNALLPDHKALYRRYYSMVDAPRSATPCATEEEWQAAQEEQLKEYGEIVSDRSPDPLSYIEEYRVVSKPPTVLTKRDMDTIRLALNYAMDERDSFADANRRSDPKIAADCDKLVRRFERMHVKLFGRKSRRQEIIDQDAAAPRETIFELAQRMDGDGARRNRP